MEEASRAQDAIQELLGDAEPAPFREHVLQTLADRSPVLGVLTIRTALAADGTVSVDTAADRAAGVQLTYEGLSLTQQLIDDEPWPPTEGEAPDVDLVAAEVLVAKGLTRLAHTGVRERVVEIVRRFGRLNASETDSDVATDDASTSPTARADPSLDSDFVVLAVAAGADLAVQTVPPGLVEYARDLATEIEQDPLAADDGLPDLGDDVARILAAADSAAEERSRSSTLDP